MLAPDGAHVGTMHTLAPTAAAYHMLLHSPWLVLNLTVVYGSGAQCMQDWCSCPGPHRGSHMPFKLTPAYGPVSCHPVL